MPHRWAIRALAGLVVAIVLMALNANDFDQEPPTDTADVVATWMALGGAVIWFALRRADHTKPVVYLIANVAAGVALGAVVIGLASVVYDPWAP